jgi:hypothetical protein
MRRLEDFSSYSEELRLKLALLSSTVVKFSPRKTVRLHVPF